MVQGRFRLTEENVKDFCPNCHAKIAYSAARPAMSGISVCPVCTKPGYFLKFLTFEVTSGRRKFSHKTGVEEWVRQKERGIRQLTEFAR